MIHAGRAVLRCRIWELTLEGVQLFLLEMIVPQNLLNAPQKSCPECHSMKYFYDRSIVMSVDTMP